MLSPYLTAGRATKVRALVPLADRHHFTTWLQRAMARQHVTQRALAARIGVHRATVQGYCSGDYFPSPMMRGRMERALGDGERGGVGAGATTDERRALLAAPPTRGTTGDGCGEGSRAC